MESSLSLLELVHSGEEVVPTRHRVGHRTGGGHPWLGWPGPAEARAERFGRYAEDARHGRSLPRCLRLGGTASRVRKRTSARGQRTSQGWCGQQEAKIRGRQGVRAGHRETAEPVELPSPDRGPPEPHRRQCGRGQERRPARRAEAVRQVVAEERKPDVHGQTRPRNSRWIRRGAWPTRHQRTWVDGSGVRPGLRCTGGGSGASRSAMARSPLASRLRRRSSGCTRR